MSCMRVVGVSGGCIVSIVVVVMVEMMSWTKKSGDGCKRVVMDDGG